MMVAKHNTGHLIVLAAGGTGGHVFPAEALAQELLAPKRWVAFVLASAPVTGSGTPDGPVRPRCR